MPRVSTKKRGGGDLTWDTPSFPDIETTDEAPVTETTKKDDKGDQSALLASLQEQVASLTSRTEELQRTNIALMAQAPGSGTGGVQLEAPKMDMTNLPDPSLDPEKYAQEVSRRVSALVQAENARNTQVANNRAALEGRVQTLWNDFESEYEEYADPERIDFIAQKVVTNMKARGVDTEKYMFGAKETFFKDVVQEYDRIFGKPGGESDLDTNTSTTRSSVDTPANRTAGIFGGLESGHSRSAGQEGPKSDMLSEIQEVQKKSGFY